MMIMQVRLRGDAFLRANIVEHAGNEQTVAFSLGPETGDHAVRVSDTTAHTLLVMLRLVARVRDGRRPHRLRDRSDVGAHYI